MTLAAIKKLAVQLPLADRLKLADAIWESIPPMREPVTLQELERRAAEVDSGKARLVSSEEFDANLAHLSKSLRRKRSAQRG